MITLGIDAHKRTRIPSSPSTTWDANSRRTPQPDVLSAFQRCFTQARENPFKSLSLSQAALVRLREIGIELHDSEDSPPPF